MCSIGDYRIADSVPIFFPSNAVQIAYQLTDLFYIFFFMGHLGQFYQVFSLNTVQTYVIFTLSSISIHWLCSIGDYRIADSVPIFCLNAYHHATKVH